MLGETVMNSLCGFVAFQVSETLPGVLARGRQSRRASLRRRDWG
jgi:hypothetical protein